MPAEFCTVVEISLIKSVSGHFEFGRHKVVKWKHKAVGLCLILPLLPVNPKENKWIPLLGSTC